MKKHFTLFFVYASIVIAGLCLFLVFHNKNYDKTYNNNPKQEETEGNSSTNNNNNQENVGNESNKDEDVDNTIYATKLTLNCARSIDVATNSKVVLVEEYLTIEPADAKLTITITAESGALSDLTFESNVISVKGKGKYRIRFSSKKNSTTEISDTLVVNVKENLPSLINAKLSVVTLGDSKSIFDIFNFDSSITNKIVQTDDKITFSNNTLTATETGTSYITIFYDVGLFRFEYSATITIKAVPQYAVVLVDASEGAIINGNTITYTCDIGRSLYIQYDTLNRNEEHVDQFISISLDNNDIASYVLTEPIIRVTCLRKGSVKLTISCINDAESSLTLTIVFN